VVATCEFAAGSIVVQHRPGQRVEKLLLLMGRAGRSSGNLVSGQALARWPLSIPEIIAVDWDGRGEMAAFLGPF